MSNDSAPRTLAEFQARWWEVIEEIEERRAREARSVDSSVANERRAG